MNIIEKKAIDLRRSLTTPNYYPEYPKLSDEWVKAIVVFPNRQSERDYLEIKNTPQDCEVFDSIDNMIEAIKKEKVMELTSDDLSQLENIFMPRTADTTITN